jgi:hypothetical protein
MPPCGSGSVLNGAKRNGGDEIILTALAPRKPIVDRTVHRELCIATPERQRTLGYPCEAFG